MERVYQRIVSELLDEIVTGRIGAGEQLPRLEDIAARHACSPGAAREAIRALDERNVIAVHAGQGQEVLDAERWKLLDRQVAEAALLRHGDHGLLREAVDFVRMLEPLAAMRAASNASDGNLRFLSQTVDQMRGATRGRNGAESRDERFVQAEADFHRTLVQMSGNRFLASALEELHPVLVQVRRQRTADRDSLVIRLHDGIMAALGERDGTAAAAAVEAYGRHLAGWLRA